MQVATNLTTKYSSLGVKFSAANLADWIDQNGIGVVGRFSFQVHHPTSASTYALVPDYANTGPGAVSVYTMQPVTGVFQPVAGGPFPTGLQPFAVSVDPTGRFAYVPNGNSNNVSAFAIDPATGSLSALTGSPFAAGTGPISMCITPSGRFASAANWGAGNGQVPLRYEHPR